MCIYALSALLLFTVFAITTLAPLKKSVLSLLMLKAVMCHYIRTAADI